jgi:hypothetical protein
MHQALRWNCVPAVLNTWAAVWLSQLALGSVGEAAVHWLARPEAAQQKRHHQQQQQQQQ